MKKNHSCYILLLILVSLLVSCGKSKNKMRQDESYDFEKIKEDGELTILTLNSSTSYFIYREEAMGFHYDIAKAFAEAHGLKLNVKLAKNSEELIKMLKDGEGDLIAFPLPVQNDMKPSISYCGVNLITHQVLVQRTGNTLKDVTELIGKEITVRKDGRYYRRLMNLNAELGDGIEINTDIKDSITTEDLIQMVSKGEIEYTVSDEYVAKLNSTYFRNINISLPISFDQRSSWAVPKHAVQLANALNVWYTANEKEPKYKAISKKYFELSKRPFSAEFELPKDLPAGHISPYDNLFKKHAKGTRFDWQLLAAISYQESRFKNGLTSWAGASGIMGIMPKIGESFGIAEDQRMDPDLSIEAAVKLLKSLDKMLKGVEDPEERVKFILASYNGGFGHVMDVRALAKKYGNNNQVWDGSVRNWITKKRLPEYYNDPLCKSGYFRGTETLNYVDDVTRTYSRFKRETVM